ncbi:hypothetical protein JG687_00016729 [Phytophthora cactorum]|uniref:Uncharacterized protein n=1 Tax=Phytophthora cactorum TaxID=29920 RepID=A0A8T1TTS3_9STRA|nr:hypothetical protein JG687_00016729 [Phytophthora cactorum]
MLYVFLEDFPELGHYLVQDANIVHKPEFEVAIPKIINGKGSELSEYQKILLRTSRFQNQ